MNLSVAGVVAVIDGHEIVSGGDLEVEDGELVGLVGPNGSGKSTLLRCIYRVLRPYGGVIRADGDDVWSLSAREAASRTAVVVQEPPSDFDFPVRSIVMMGRLPHKGFLERETADDERIVSEAMTRTGAIGFADRSFRSLSGGEKQRVLLARALAQRSGLLVLDEPTNHLDIRHQLEVLELTRQLGITTIAALHDLNLAAAYCDRLFVMRSGAIVASGTPEAVLTPDLIADVFAVGAITTRHPRTGVLQLAFFPIG